MPDNEVLWQAYHAFVLGARNAEYFSLAYLELKIISKAVLAKTVTAASHLNKVIAITLANQADPIRHALLFFWHFSQHLDSFMDILRPCVLDSSNLFG